MKKIAALMLALVLAIAAIGLLRSRGSEPGQHSR